MNPKFQNDLRMSSPLELEVKSAAEGRIEGYASTFGGDPDAHGEIIVEGAFSASLAIHKKAGTLPVLLWSHRLEQPVGRWTKMAEDRHGLQVEGSLNLATAAGREAFEHVRAGDASGLSIGFTVPKEGQHYVGKGVFELRQVELHEISIVTLPANRNARITAVKSLGSKSEAIDMLRSCGLSKKAAARFAAGGWSALADDDYHDKATHFAREIDRAIERVRTRA